jgi:hypothetical protein
MNNLSTILLNTQVQQCSHSRTSQHFMEPKGSLLCSQEHNSDPLQRNCVNYIFFNQSHGLHQTVTSLAVDKADVICDISPQQHKFLRHGTHHKHYSLKPVFSLCFDADYGVPAPSHIIILQ